MSLIIGNLNAATFLATPGSPWDGNTVTFDLGAVAWRIALCGVQINSNDWKGRIEVVESGVVKYFFDAPGEWQSYGPVLLTGYNKNFGIRTVGAPLSGPNDWEDLCCAFTWMRVR